MRVYEVVLPSGRRLSHEDAKAVIDAVATARRQCPTCSWPSRETVGMVCQTCGADYGAEAPTPDPCTDPRGHDDRPGTYHMHGRPDLRYHQCTRCGRRRPR